MLFRKNYHPYRNGIINLILLIIIVLALLFLVGWLGYNAGLNTTEGENTDNFELSANRQIANGVDTYLIAISLAENAGLQAASGLATLDPASGRILVDVILPAGVVVPANSVLEAWLVDAGKSGGLGETSVSDVDQQYGTPFANIDFTASVNNAPYAQSIGKLEWVEARSSYHVFASLKNDLSPYDAVMITIESDNNSGNYDPRPGTPILIGKIEQKK